ncbi:MAG: TlpA disulfide reductase family protein [Verrucomicrobiota bacterium]
MPVTTWGQEAPELKVDSWVHLPQGMETGPTLKKDWAGKVVYLYFFQSWCPGCHSSGLPALRSAIDTYGDNDQVRLAAVQTVFEGFYTNTEDAAIEIVERYQLESIPVGQSGTRESASKVMIDFRTRGTPWTVIIAPDGEIVYSDFHISPDKARHLIDGLLEQ